MSIHLSSWAEVLLVLAEAGFLFRVLTRPHREPASRLAWIIVIIALPLLGMIAYLMLGETRISGRRRSRGREIDARLPRPKGDESWLGQVQASPQQAPFALARSINALDPTSGNNARIAADSNVAIEEMVADIDAAKRHVHICTYIWLTDHNGLKVKDACIRAAERGVEVRILADALGSHRLIRSFHWNEMRDKGCHARVALPVGNPLWTLIRGRVDLRNHRKLLVIDNGIAWCGSQNIADPEFRIKPHYAPWVDIMTRWEGPAAQHCQFLFVSDWIAEGGEDISGLLSQASAPARTNGQIVAQVIGTGPTLSFDAMPACFSELIHSARQELVVTTPYFVPDEQLLFALTSAARRGVKTIMAVPKRCDSRVVAATCQSYYGDLLKAGIELYEYRKGLLHAKTMVADRSVVLIGSANLDRRSFELNFENNILFADRAFAAAVRDRQAEYLADSDRVTAEEVAAFGIGRRLWQNLLATMSPVL
ncbi:MAG TPA: cardiolipin synthase [Sphingomicrobium sp.]|nr:cardiolipin synthase [Sphingomicrobium sp.]